MKVMTLVEGFDGIKHYDAGTVMTGGTDHIRRLLHNKQATPLDDEAKEYQKAHPPSSFQESTPKPKKKKSK